MITTTHYNAKALQPNGSPDPSPRGPCAEYQRMPVTIRRRLRSMISSPRWRLAALISAILFVGSSAAQHDMMDASFRITGAKHGKANGLYEPVNTGNIGPFPMGITNIKSHEYATRWKDMLLTHCPECNPKNDWDKKVRNNPKLKPRYCQTCIKTPKYVPTFWYKNSKNGCFMYQSGRIWYLNDEKGTFSYINNVEKYSETRVPPNDEWQAGDGDESDVITLEYLGRRRRRLTSEVAGNGRNDRLRDISIHHLRRLRASKTSRRV